MALFGRAQILGGRQTTSAWTPATIDADLRFWYDGVGSVSGSTLLDLSSANRDLTKTGTVNTGTVSLNGINVLDFAGGRYTSGDAASTWKYMHDGTTAFTVVAVVKFADETTCGLFGTDAGGTANIGVSAYWDDAGATNNNFIFEITRGVSGPTNARYFANRTATSLLADQWALITIQFDAGNATLADRGGLRFNGGGQTLSPQGSGAVSTANPSFTFQLGAAGNSVVPLTGQIAEIFAYNSAAATIADAEGYMDTKYAL